MLVVHSPSWVTLEAEQTEPGVWQTAIGEDLRSSGAANDDQVLAAARELLVLADPGTAARFNISAPAAVVGQAATIRAAWRATQRGQVAVAGMGRAEDRVQLTALAPDGAGALLIVICVTSSFLGLRRSISLH